MSITRIFLVVFLFRVSSYAHSFRHWLQIKTYIKCETVTQTNTNSQMVSFFFKYISSIKLLLFSLQKNIINIGNSFDFLMKFPYVFAIKKHILDTHAMDLGGSGEPCLTSWTFVNEEKKYTFKKKSVILADALKYCSNADLTALNWLKSAFYPAISFGQKNKGLVKWKWVCE